jgi:hypothetical protein
MSVFSGLYKVMQIKNNFSRGQFTQELDLVRLSRQTKFDYVNNQNNTTNAERAASAALPDKLGVPGPGSNAVDLPDANAAKESISSAADAEGGNQTPTEDPGDVETYPLAETPTTEQKDLMDLNMTAPTAAISNNTTPQQTGPAEPPPAPIPTLPSGVTQDPTSGNYKYKGLVIPADPGTDQFNQYITAVDNKQTVQVTQIDNVSGNPVTRTFDGNYTQAAVERAQNNVTFAERELARFENKVKTDPEFQNLNAEQQTNLNVARARRQAEVSAAKSSLAQAQAGK